MKKIPTLFIRKFEDGKIVGITKKVTPGMEWVLEGEGKATIKMDGACCAVINGEFYKRFDAKPGRKIPEGAIPCCDPDPITGHHPHWVKISEKNPADKWFIKAYENTSMVYRTICVNDSYPEMKLKDGTYEAIGKHFNGNPYGLKDDKLLKHGDAKTYPIRSFDGIKAFLECHDVEGIVFWKDGEPKCKIKRTDFGFRWPMRSN